MTWNDFFKALKGNGLAPAYIFAGPEEHIKREALQALRGKLLPPGLEALNEAALESATAQQIIEAAETLPVMCDRRLVTVVDWAPLMNKRSKEDEESLKRVSQWLKSAPDTCTVVFYLRSPGDGERKAFVNPLGECATVVLFEPLSGAELTRWCARRLNPLGKKISHSALNLLADRVGSGLTRLSTELDKLAAHAGERAEITTADVEALVPPSLEENIFKLTDMLLTGNMGDAQLLIRELLQHGEKAIGIMANLGNQLRLMSHMKCALDAGGNAPTVQAQLKLSPGRTKVLARQVARLNADALTRLFDLYVTLDGDVKSGRARDRDALDRLAFAVYEIRPRR